MNAAILSQDSSLISTFLASFLIWFLYIGLVVLWFHDGKKWKEIALHAFFASVVAWVLVEVIKEIMPVIRPFQMTGYPPLTITFHNDPSFPSGHAAISFALATSIWFHDKKVGMIYFIGAFFVALGRVLTNVHFPIDVIAGSILGVASAVLVDKLHPTKLIGKRKR